MLSSPDEVRFLSRSAGPSRRHRRGVTQASSRESAYLRCRPVLLITARSAISFLTEGLLDPISVDFPKLSLFPNHPLFPVLV
jgi:hypothetical protein